MNLPPKRPLRPLHLLGEGLRKNRIIRPTCITQPSLPPPASVLAEESTPAPCEVAPEGTRVYALVATHGTPGDIRGVLLSNAGQTRTLHQNYQLQSLSDLGDDTDGTLPYLLVESVTKAIRGLGEAILLPWIQAGRLIDIELLGTLTILALDGTAPDRPTLKELRQFEQRHLRHVLPGQPQEVCGPPSVPNGGATVKNLLDRAVRLLQVGLPYIRYAEAQPQGDCARFWGLAAQVKARIAMDAMEARGVHINRPAILAALVVLKGDLSDMLLGLQKFSKGRLTESPRPAELWPLVMDASKRLGMTLDKPNFKVPPTRRLLETMEEDPAVAVLMAYLAKKQLISECGRLLRGEDIVIHPTFTTLVRSGRISCHGPNIQQIPREGGIREFIVPAPGYLFLSLDYRCIELFALAAHCREREPDIPLEVLGDMLEAGEDLHQWTASQLFNKRPEEVSPSERQVGKIFNFAIPANAGIERLQEEVNRLPRVEMSEEEVKDLKARWLDTFLAVGRFHHHLERDTPPAAMDLARKYQSDHHKEASEVIQNAVRLAGGANADKWGDPFCPTTQLHLWDVVKHLVPRHRPELLEKVEDRESSATLQRAVDHGYTVDLPSGRRRTYCSYTAALNTVFQGRVADGVKGALWELHSRGHRVVNVIHDEFVIEIPEGADHLALARDIRRIVLDAMHQVIPLDGLEVEYALTRRWSKGAKARLDSIQCPTRLLVSDTEEDHSRVPPPEVLVEDRESPS